MKTQISKNFDEFTFIAKRDFDSPISDVWRAFSETHLIEKWWAPKPWRCESKVMEFKPNGKWIYDMVGPKGERHGSLQIYKEIEFEKKISGTDAFIDDNGKIKSELPISEFEIIFTPKGEITTVTFISKYSDEESLALILELGLEKGLNMALDNLEELLFEMKK